MQTQKLHLACYMGANKMYILTFQGTPAYLYNIKIRLDKTDWKTNDIN